MRQQTASRLAWLLWILAIMCAAASFVFIWLSRSAPVADVIGFRGFDAILAVVFASVGVVVASRRPSHPVGWLLFAFGAGNAPVSLLQQYAFYAIIGRAEPLPGAIVAAWVQEWISVSGGAVFVLLLLLFPTGRLPSRRWRVVAALAIASSVLEALGGALRSGPIATFRVLDNPYAPTGALQRAIAAADTVGNVLFAVTILGAVVSIVLRFRRAERVEQQQLKWIAAAATLVGVGLIGFVLTGQEAGGTPWARPVQIYFIVAICGVPIAAAVAILRYRLFDIDRMISRSISYAIVTALLGAVFTLFVVVPSVALGGRHVPDYVIAGATLVVAMLFRPVLRRVQSGVDHRFNRTRYDAGRTIEDFAARLRDQVDLSTLRAEMEGLVSSTMQPSHVRLWLKDDS